MSGKASSSLKELKNLREAVLAEEKARTQAFLQNLPQSQTESARADAELVEADAAPSEPEVLAPPPPPPPPPRPKPAPTVVPRSAPVPVAAPAAKPKPPTPKEAPALIIPLTPKMQERLQRNVESARWTPAELVMEIMRVSLHRGYPAIHFGNDTIARAGTYRTIERNPFDAVLKIISGQGVFTISVKPENPEYQRWFSYFQEQGSANPEKSASQVCLFSLQSYLENVDDFQPDGWVKIIPEDAYSISGA